MATVSRNPSTGTYLVCILVACIVPLFVGWFIFCDWVLACTTDHLSRATYAEVRVLLGDPIHESSLGQGEVRWFYRRYGRLAEFQVDFDESGWSLAGPTTADTLAS